MFAGSVYAKIICIPDAGHFTVKYLVCWVKLLGDHILKYFSEKKEFDITCKFPHKETIGMMPQNLSSGKCKKKSICCLLNLPRMLKLNLSPTEPGYVLPFQTV